MISLLYNLIMEEEEFATFVSRAFNYEKLHLNSHSSSIVVPSEDGEDPIVVPLSHFIDIFEVISGFSDFRILSYVGELMGYERLVGGVYITSTIPRLLDRVSEEELQMMADYFGVPLSGHDKMVLVSHFAAKGGFTDYLDSPPVDFASLLDVL